MFAEATQENTYRAKLEALLLIPVNASDQTVHELIERGFLANEVAAFFQRTLMSNVHRNSIISSRRLKLRLAHHQRLTTKESDRLFRVAHILAMAQTIFGSDQKAHRWLNKSKVTFSGDSPMGMLSTTPGTYVVESMLIQLAEGMAF